MENTELQEVWKNIDNEINYKSKDELSLLLKSKAKQTLNKFLVIMSFSILTSIGLLTFLLITSINRRGDLIYLINNITLGIITITALITGLLSWYKIQSNKFNQSLKDWLNERINLLSKWLTGKYSKLYLFLIPLLYILTVLSIHVYFENKTFTEVMKTEESIVGLIIALPIGLFVSFFSVRKIRKSQLQNLNFLKDLYGRLCNVR
jgi:ABC-type enterochelin transport system permease subunit